MTQPSLFEDDATTARVDRSAFHRAHRHRLDDASWITHVPGLLIGHHALMADLAASAGWERRQRWMFDQVVDEPRLTAEYDDPSRAPAPIPDLAAALDDEFGPEDDVEDGGGNGPAFRRVWLNWYRDQDDGTGWHADRPANRRDTAVIPVLTLGAPRRFLIRPSGGGPSTAFTPAGGDLLVMHGRCQRDWKHCVPNQKAVAGGRMSINFSSGVAAGG